MNTAVILDTETTGLDAPELIECAWLRIDINGTIIERGPAERFRPSKAITLGAMATHHIMDEDLVGCPHRSLFRVPDTTYLIGYNVDFDWRVIGEPPVRRIDVCSMCRHPWPEADSHSQSAMLYLLEREAARDALRGAHSAEVDAAVCLAILKNVMFKAGPFVDFEQLWQASERMRIPTKMPFGKHKGMLIGDIPRDYRQWLLRQSDIDTYLVQAVRQSMAKVPA